MAKVWTCEIDNTQSKRVSKGDALVRRLAKVAAGPIKHSRVSIVRRVNLLPGQEGVRWTQWIRYNEKPVVVMTYSHGDVLTTFFPCLYGYRLQTFNDGDPLPPGTLFRWSGKQREKELKALARVLGGELSRVVGRLPS